jgi:hypothetical protein
MNYPKQKVILINPSTQTVTEHQITAGGGTLAQQDQHMADMYGLLECSLFTVACVVSDGNDLFVDDDGLFKEGQKFFAFESEHMGEMPYAGNGLVIGYDPKTGASLSTTLTVPQIYAKVRWLSDGDVEY